MGRILILKEAAYGSREEEPTMTRLMQGNYAGKPNACTICGNSPVVAGAQFRNPLGNVNYTHHLCEPCADQYDIMHSADTYKGEPMDLAMQLLKAYLPTLQERGRKIDDQVSLRWIPRYNESTFNAPVPFHSSRGNVNWEQRLRNEKLDAPKGSAHSERKTLPGVFEGDSKTPSNNPITGSWVAPATQQGAMGADVSFNDKGLLMAINENPDWWRTVQQGAAQESPAGEGFKFGGFDKEAFSKVPTPNISPISMLHYQMALENPMLEEDEVAQQFPNEHELITQFPNIKTEDIWGPPADLTINPFKVASEPMEIAMRLLKGAFPLSSPSMVGHTEEYENFFNENILPQAENEEHAKRLKLAFYHMQNFYLPKSFTNNPGSSYKDRFTSEDKERSGRYRNLGRAGYKYWSDANKKGQSLSTGRGEVHPREYLEEDDLAEQEETRELLSNSKDAPYKTTHYAPTFNQMQFLAKPMIRHNENKKPLTNTMQNNLIDASVRGQLSSGPFADLEYERQFMDLPLIQSVTPKSPLQSELVYGELNDNSLFNVGEPMDIAMRLLKEEPLHLRNSAELAELARQGDEQAYIEMMNRTGDYYLANEITGEPDMEANLEAYGAETGKNPFKTPTIGRSNQVQIQQSPVTPIHADKKLHNWQYKNASEPMDIAMRLLKERVSPEAKRHKLEYDKKYESNPERVKYREELNRERRRRHIMGQGGPDMSHTSQHTIVPEDPHTNRARHFKDKGTLL